MCGIAGTLRSDGSHADERLLHGMLRIMQYRGPDEQGIHVEGPLGLAHARLSIIDLQEGQQPMADGDDATLWISFNGEIFNYVELKKELEGRGHRFRTHSDTEVILQAYRAWGEDCVQHFNGQWAFAIWDRPAKKLFLSRDRMGVRPLFYTIDQERFTFASEVKAIFADPSIKRELDLESLNQVFTYWVTLGDRTMFKGIKELPPGCSLVLAGGKAVIHQYWKPTFTPAESGWRSPQEEQALADQLLELLEDATRIRLRSDVPVGAYLSGGLDSTLVTALIRRCSNAPLKTFSVGFEDAEFDERAYQRESVGFLQTEHQSVECSKKDIGEIFPQVVWHAEKTLLRTAPAPLLVLSRLVREQGFKVVLTGEGSDEVLGGYDLFKEAKIRRFWGRQLSSHVRPRLLKRLYPYMPGLQDQSDSYLKAFFHVQEETLSDPLFSHVPRWDLTAKVKSFLSPDARKGEPGFADMRREIPPELAGWDSFAQAQYLEMRYLLPGYILSSQGDRVAMANSVELRHPFLDYRVIEFAAKLPPALKMKVLNEKYLLKRVAAGLIPESVRTRSKQPYRAPDGPCFVGKAPLGYVEDMLSERQLKRHGLFNAVAVQKLVEKIRSGKAIGTKDNMALVGVLSTQLVMEQFVSNQSQGPSQWTQENRKYAVLS